MLAQPNFRVTMSSSNSRGDLDQGFDRERILEWLESVDLNQPVSEQNEGSLSDPDQSPGLQLNPSQPTPLRLSPLLRGRRRPPVPSPITTHSQQQQKQQQPSAAWREGGPVTESVGISSRIDLAFSQSQVHLSTLRTRQKSESPLPEVWSYPELPTFNPQTPTLPGKRTPKQPPIRSVSLSLPAHPRPSLASTTAAAAAATTTGKEDLTLSDTLQDESERDVGEGVTGGSETKADQQSPHLREEEEEEEVMMTRAPQLLPTPPTQQVPSSTPYYHRGERRILRQTPLEEEEATAVDEILPSQGSGSGETLSRDIKPEGEMEGEMEGEREGEREGGEGVPLTPVELATLSLQVGDILPQLAVYLGVEYEEYEKITSTEPSLQRQSMAVLMRWFRSCSADSRQELAHSLQLFGREYSHLAQMLLECKLEECRQPYKPAASPSPAHLSGHSPQSAPPQAHQSQDVKSRTLTSPTSLTPPPPLVSHTRKLRQGFTFDEDRRSSDVMPRFLSTRSLQTPSSSRKVLSFQRHLSLSEDSSQSSSSSPAAPGLSSLGTSPRLPGGRRKSSLQLDEMIQTTTSGGGGGSSGEEGRLRYHALGRRKSSLERGELLRMPLEGDRDDARIHYKRSNPLLHHGSMESSLAPLTAGASRECAGSSVQDTKPHRYGSSDQRKMKRQDSGIETLASNLSGIQ